MSLIVCNSI